MSELTCGSLFSGVGGMDIGLAWAGFRHVFLCEIDPFCQAVLRARFPGVHIYDDVRDVGRHDDPDGAAGSERTGVDAGLIANAGQGGIAAGRPLDLLTSTFPCQDISVAGKRAGLAGERSGLFHESMRVVDALRPRAILIENVEGLYSSGSPRGSDFGIVLDSLAARGYLATWRTLDAQFFGVPQRRRRVFVVAIADGDPGAERIGEVLAVAESSGGNSPTSDPTWPHIAPAARGGAEGGSGRVIGALSHSGGAMTMDHQSFVGAGQYVLPHEIRSRVVGCLTDPSRMDEQCVGGGQLITGSDVAPTVTAKWAKGSGGPSGSETGNLVVEKRKRERERES